MATVPAGNGPVNIEEGAAILPDGLPMPTQAALPLPTVTGLPPLPTQGGLPLPTQAVPSNLVNSERSPPGATLTEGAEPPKRKTTSFKITNVFQSRPPSNDPDDIWEDGDDVDDSRTEDLSDIADSLTSLSSLQAELGQGVEAGQVASTTGQVAPPPGQAAPPPGQAAPSPPKDAPAQGLAAPPPGQAAPTSSPAVAPSTGQTAPPPVQGAPSAPATVSVAPPPAQVAPPSGQVAPSSGQTVPQRGQVVTVGQNGPGPGGQVVSSVGQQVVMPQLLPPVLQQQVSCPQPGGLAPVQDTGRRPSHDPKLSGEARRLSTAADENNQERAFQQGQAPYHLPGFGFVTFQPEGLPVTYVDYSGHLITAMVPATGSSVDKSGVSEDNQVLPVHGPLDIRSRFKIVKIETTEPIKRGRWTCFDFLDKQTDQKIVTTGGTGALPSDVKKTVSTVGPKSAVPASLTKPSAVPASSTAKVVVTQAGKVPLVPSSVSKPAVTLSSANASVANSATVSAVNTPDAMPSSVLTRGTAGQPRGSDVAEVGRFKVASSEPPPAQARGSTSGPGSVEREIEGARAESSRIQRTSGSRPPDPLRVSDGVYPSASYPGGQSSLNGPNYINISPQAGSPYATVNQPVIQSPVAVQGRPDFGGQQQQASGHIGSGQQIQQHSHSSQSQASSGQQFTTQKSSSPQSTVSENTGQLQLDSGQMIVQDVKTGQQYIVQQPSQQSNQQPTNNHPNQQTMASGHPVQQASSHPAQQASSHPSQQQASGHTGQQVVHIVPSSGGHTAASVGHTQVGGSIPTSGHTQVVGSVAVSGRHSSIPGSVGSVAVSVPTTVGSVSSSVGHPQQFQPQVVQQVPLQQLIQQANHPHQQHTQSHVQQLPNQTQQVSSQNQQVQTQSVSQTQQVIKQTQPQQVSSQPPSIPPPSTQKKHSSSSQQAPTSQPTLPPTQPGVVNSIGDLINNQPGTPPIPSNSNLQQVVTQRSAGSGQHSQNLVYGATPGHFYAPQGGQGQGYPQQGYNRSVSHQPSTEVYNHHPGVEGEILAERLEEIVKEEQAVEDGLAARPEEETESGSGAGQASIDNRIEQAMDLVKSHLMNAVRSEVEELKDKINKLEDTISHLSRENELLRSRASPETLQMVTGGASQPSQPPDPAKPPVQQH